METYPGTCCGQCIDGAEGFIPLKADILARYANFLPRPPGDARPNHRDWPKPQLYPCPLAWLLGKGIELYYSGEEEEEKAVREIIDALCG